MTKQVNATWVAGDTNGGLDTGTIAANTGYHVYLIYNVGTTTLDVLISLSATAPTLPSGYTKFRRIGSMLTNSTPALRDFVQVGRWFNLEARTTDFSAQANGSASNFLRQVSLPQGKKFLAKFYLKAVGTGAGTFLSGIYDPDMGTPPVFGGATEWGQVMRCNTTTQAAVIEQFSDNNRQIYTSASDTAELIDLGVLSWLDEADDYT
jgi:hypothetical protein